MPRAADVQLEPSFVALLEDDTLDPATDLSHIAVREQHADDSPYAASAYYPNDAFSDSWQQSSDDEYNCEDSRMAQGSWDDVELEADCEDCTMAQGSFGSAELENDDFAVKDGGLVDEDADVGDGGLVHDDTGVVGDGDVWDGVNGDVWDGFDLEDVEMEEVEANKLVEDDSASRPGVGIGAGVGAAASVVGPSRLPEVLAAKWQAADTQVRILLTHRSLHCTNLESFRLRLAHIWMYVYVMSFGTCCF